MAKATLAALLADLFSVEELRCTLLQLPPGADLVDALPGVNTPKRTYVDEAVAKLSRLGMIDETLFQLLREERPGRVADIDVVARAVAADPSSADAARRPGSDARLALMVGCLPSPRVGPKDVVYRAEIRDGALHIGPSLDYLDLLDAGGPIGPLKYHWSPFNAHLPVLDIKVVNNTRETVLFGDATLEVESSRTDLRPLLVLNGTGAWMGLPLINLGFGPASSCILRFDVGTHEAQENWDDPMPFQIDATHDLDRARWIDLGGVFERLGVDVAEIRALRQAEELGQNFPVVGRPQIDQEDRVRRAQAAIGPFDRGVARVWGTIGYTGSESPAIVRTIRFSTELSLLWKWPEAPLKPSMEYEVELATDRQNYTVQLSIAHELKPGETDRWTVKLGASKASLHRFKVRLGYGNGRSVESSAIELDLFLSRADDDMIYAQGSSPTAGRSR